jgi:hypothetical protein
MSRWRWRCSGLVRRLQQVAKADGLTEGSGEWTGSGSHSRRDFCARVAGADNADGAGNAGFAPGATAEADSEDSDGYWWWQSTEARAAKWVVPQREVLAAGRVGWEGGLNEEGESERE